MFFLLFCFFILHIFVQDKMNCVMQNQQPLANNHISVDCVVIGFDGEQLKVLLINRTDEVEGKTYHDMKLPGSLIYMDEDLDEAAQRVLFELTGVKNIDLMQFKAFGSKNRTKNDKDVRWLERAMQSKVERIVTIAYLSMVKIVPSMDKSLEAHQACWVPLHEMKELAFDHNLIIKEALKYIRQIIETNPAVLFTLLPKKFTASQLRVLFELIYDKPIDVRNFHKKMAVWSFIVPLEERQTGVAHLAARYYKFDRKIYNKQTDKI